VVLTKEILINNKHTERVLQKLAPH